MKNARRWNKIRCPQVHIVFYFHSYTLYEFDWVCPSLGVIIIEISGGLWYYHNIIISQTYERMNAYTLFYNFAAGIGLQLFDYGWKSSFRAMIIYYIFMVWYFCNLISMNFVWTVLRFWIIKRRKPTLCISHITKYATF